jgi:hypothetical protein
LIFIWIAENFELHYYSRTRVKKVIIWKAHILCV